MSIQEKLRNPTIQRQWSDGPVHRAYSGVFERAKRRGRGLLTEPAGNRDDRFIHGIIGTKPQVLSKERIDNQFVKNRKVRTRFFLAKNLLFLYLSLPVDFKTNRYENKQN